MTRVETMPRTIRPAIALLAALVLFAATLATAGPASAHARLVSSSPEDGAHLTAAPVQIMLTFSEQIGTSFATVEITKGGTSAAKGKPQVEGSRVFQEVDPTMAEGDWEVSYRVVSADGHPISGTYSFVLGESDGASDDSVSSSSSPTSAESSTSTTKPSSTTTTTSEPTTSEPTTSTTGSSNTEAVPPTTAPSTSSSSTTAAAPSGDEDAGSDIPLPWLAAALAALLAIVAALLLLARRRRRDREFDDSFGPRGEGSYGRPIDD
ncbi:copper resistance CopC family protein [Janibacter sp. G1551]|uniref:copper resistance CopC family protein n=1 Tax=Janibacter sp. G1551 TaxID=3420440 RepID=UPI003CFD96E0